MAVATNCHQCGGLRQHECVYYLIAMQVEVLLGVSFGSSEGVRRAELLSRGSGETLLSIPLPFSASREPLYSSAHGSFIFSQPAMG